VRCRISFFACPGRFDIVKKQKGIIGGCVAGVAGGWWFSGISEFRRVFKSNTTKRMRRKIDLSSSSFC
jgi:hypothetical protein